MFELCQETVNLFELCQETVNLFELCRETVNQLHLCQETEKEYKRCLTATSHIWSSVQYIYIDYCKQIKLIRSF